MNQSQKDRPGFDPEFALRIIELMGEGLVVSDERETIYYANPAILEMTGFPEKELIGKSSEKLIAKSGLKSYRKALKERETEGKSVYQTHLVKKSGAHFPVRITTVAPVRIDGLEGSIAVVNDLTTQVRSEADLHLFREVMAHANDGYLLFRRLHDDELTPIYQNDAFEKMFVVNSEETRDQHGSFLCGLMVKKSVAEEAKESVIRGKPYRNQTLFSRRDGVKFWGDFQLLPITNPADEQPYAAMILRDITEIRKRESELNRALDRAERVMQEKEKLLSGISHELRTPASGIMGMAELLSATDLDSKQKEFLDAILESAGDLVRLLNDLLGGEITVTSRTGERTTFQIDVPMKSAERLPPDSDDVSEEIDDSGRKAKHMAALEGKRVMVVDDHPINRRLAENILELYGAKVLSAADGKEALDLLNTEPIDLVLMDVHMPGIDGLEVTKKMRSEYDDPISRLPVVAMTASALQNDLRLCRDAGMNAFVSKPFRQEALLEVIVGLMEAEHPEELSIEVPRRSEEVIASTGGVVNFSILTEMTLGDKSMMLELMELFLEQTPGLLKDLREHSETGNWIELATTAHTLKPTFNYMGMNDAYQLAFELEKIGKDTGADRSNVKSRIDRIESMVDKAILEIEKSVEELKKELS